MAGRATLGTHMCADQVSEQVGIIGLGRMGSAMARRIIASGRPVIGWARDARARAALEAAGGAATDDFARLSDVDIVITMVTDDDATREVVMAPGTLLDILRPNGVHLSMSTISPELSRQLAVAHQDKGQRYLGAPVFGRPEAAAAGALSIVCAGPEYVFEEVKTVLATMGTPRWVGKEPDQANLIKLMGNHMIFVSVMMLGEMFAFLRKAEVTEKDAQEVIVNRLFPGPIFTSYAQKIINREFQTAAANFKLGRKDNRLCLEAAERLGVNLPLARLLRDRIDALFLSGNYDQDVTGIARQAALEAHLDF